jgi:predicted nucleic acid-binding protein
MIVICDTSPILYLLLINHLDLLPQLYGQVIIPKIVRDELVNPGAPVELQQWITNPPGWLIVQPVTSTPDATLSKLNPGEQAAITLAQECIADLLIIDERAGRRAATNLGIPIIGTLGILDEAASQGLLNFAEAIAQLTATNFRASPRLIQTLLDRYSKEK